jgi:MFS family permease
VDAPALLTGATTASREWTPRSIYVLGLLTLSYALNHLDRSILSLVLPQIKAEMHLSDTVLGLVSGFAFVLFYSLLGVPIARLADRSSRRNILGIGLAFWSVMTSLTGYVANVWQLAVSRFLMGAGEACGVAPANAMVADLFSKARRSLAVAILASGSSLAFVVFFPLAGWIADTWGWRAAFIAAGVPGIVLALLLFTTVTEPVRAVPAGGAAARDSLLRTAWFLCGSKAFVYTVAGGACMGISLYASAVWNPMFLVRVHGFSVTDVGATVGPLRGIAGFGGVILGGWLADRLGRRDPRWYLATPAIACILVLPADLVFLLADPIGLSLAGLAVAQFCTSMHMGPVYAACMAVARPQMRATASAIFLLVANLVGQVIGPLLVGYLNDRLRVVHGELAIRYSLIVGAVCAALAGAFLLRAGRAFGADSQRAGDT